MKKSTKIILGLGVLVVVGYLIYDQSSKNKSTDSKKTNASGKTDYRCPKGYTYRDGYCMPKDGTKTVIKAANTI